MRVRRLKPVLRKLLKLTIIFGLLYIIISVFAKPHYIHGNCMEPAVRDGSLRLVNYVYYKINRYRSGDIVTFWPEDMARLSMQVF